jgi:signal transduction histidine kinase
MFGTFMMFLNKENYAVAVFWDKFIYLGVVFVPAVMYHFSLAITNDDKRTGKVVSSIGYLVSFFFFFSVFSDNFVKGVFVYQWGIHTQAQFLHHIFLSFFFVYICLFFVRVSRYYRITKIAIERAQLRYVFLAFFILATIGPLAYLPAYGIGIYPFEYISGAAFAIILAYAILRYRLMDIKVALRRGAVFVSSIILIILVAYLLQYAFSVILFLPASSVNIVTLLLCLAIFKYIERYFYRVANKYFFTSLYDSRKIIRDLSEALASTIDSKKIYQIISQSVNSALHPKSLAVLANRKDGKFIVEYVEGISLNSVITIDKKSFSFFSKNSAPVITEELAREDGANNQTFLNDLKQLQAAVAIPLKTNQKFIGVIVLGNKEANDIYSREDIETLRVIGRQAAMAIDNGLLYTEVSHFNLSLREKVKQATKELRLTNKELLKVNAQLKKLDEAKSEFISIASHQLRTPLTAIKGYGSMLLEGDFGEIKEQKQKDALEKMVISNNRLISLVENLLNVSRIESGRLRFDFKEQQLEDLVAESVSTLQKTAENAGLYLKFEKPASSAGKPLPAVYMDDEKIRQVALNFIDNAIKYTQTGGITIHLFAKDGSVVCKVSDTGMGVSETDKKRLFQKFTRGKDAFLVNTEGMGMGLYVAQMMVASHKGKIWVESDGEGKGSSFCFSLPVATSSAAKQLKAEMAKERAGVGQKAGAQLKNVQV